MRTKHTKQNGFTFIEIMLAMSIFVLIGLSFTLFARNIWYYNSIISSGLSQADSARIAFKKMTAEIRTASDADTGAYTIHTALASSFIFHSDIDGDGLKERVRYFLSGTSLQKGVIKPTGSPLTYNSANETISTFINSSVSSLLFQYYDKNYDGTTAALTMPVNIPNIRLVKITIIMDKDPNRPPLPVTSSTQVAIRNLKDNL